MAGAVLIVLALVGWIAFSGVLGGGVEAATPPPVTSAPGGAVGASPATAPSSAVPSPTADPTPTPSPTTRAPVVTPPRTPGPNERKVPNVIGKYEIEADYTIRSAGLVPEYTYLTAPDTCAVTALSPAANTIVPVGSTVRITVTRSSEDCQPV